MSAIGRLRESVLEANLMLRDSGLVDLTWGNVSGRDPQTGFVAIKPSGVPYDDLTVEDMVVLDADGRPVEGSRRPSSDTPTHMALYQAFPSVHGVAHTHSRHAVMFAQAQREIPCLGTTHADAFEGSVPLTRPLTRAEVDEAYETWTGRVIVECIQPRDPLTVPGVLVPSHGPFTWGASAADAVHVAIALEAVAHMAWGTLLLRPDAPALPETLRAKHFGRKHGPGAYYGQPATDRCG
jgi:L-ribulose-5-phosphate 4-epimerase